MTIEPFQVSRVEIACIIIAGFSLISSRHRIWLGQFFVSGGIGNPAAAARPFAIVPNAIPFSK